LGGWNQILPELTIGFFMSRIILCS